MTKQQVIADYHSFDYKKHFWENQGREYEDMADRHAIRTLIPSGGKRMADICGGYGRLLNEYIGKYEEVILFDYAQTLLDQAKAEYGDTIKVLQGSAYEVPVQDNTLELAVMVRASHHFDKLPLVIKELKRIVKPNGKIVVEIANKRNVLEVMRWVLGRSTMQPFSLMPTSRNSQGFYNYHPKYIEGVFKQEGLRVVRTLSVSNFRNPFLKKVLGAKPLMLLEKATQRLLAPFKISPSIYYLLEKKDA